MILRRLLPALLDRPEPCPSCRLPMLDAAHRCPPAGSDTASRTWADDLLDRDVEHFGEARP